MTQEQMKTEIDKMTYTQMLYKMRKEPVGSPWFMGKIGDYFMKVMKQKEIDMKNEDKTSISKLIGWE